LEFHLELSAVGVATLLTARRLPVNHLAEKISACNDASMLIDIQTAVRTAGSPTELALMLRLDRRKGGQRVSQWLRRKCIPLNARIEYARIWRKLARQALNQKAES
jgi:hypothetical protein